MLEVLGLGCYEVCECVDLFCYFNIWMVEEMVKGENDLLFCVVVYKCISVMLSEIIIEDWEYLLLI